MTTTTPYASLFASYRHNFHDDLLHAGSTDVTPHSATLLSAHLGLLSSIFGRQADVLPQDRDRRAVMGTAARERGVTAAADGNGPDAPGCELRVELESRELWSKFNTHCTEMVITKSGRYATSSHLKIKRRLYVCVSLYDLDL